VAAFWNHTLSSSGTASHAKPAPDLQQVFVVGFSDGPSEVHRISVARALLKDASPANGVWPREHIPTRLGLVPDDVRESLEHHIGNL
jgi:hypothetical protein